MSDWKQLAIQQELKDNTNNVPSSSIILDWQHNQGSDQVDQNEKKHARSNSFDTAVINNTTNTTASTNHKRSIDDNDTSNKRRAIDTSNSDTKNSSLPSTLLWYNNTGLTSEEKKESKLPASKIKWSLPTNPIHSTYTNSIDYKIEQDKHNDKRIYHKTATPNSSYKTLVGGVLVDGENNTALHLAIQNGAKNTALEMIRYSSCIDHTNIKGVTALALASQRGYLTVVQKLLEAGANPQLANVSGQTPLIQACHQGHLDTVKCLVEHGAVVEHANYNRTTALMRAAQEGHNQIVCFLLKNKANVNRKNGEQLSPLMLAAQRGHAEVVHVLIMAGADINAKSAQGSTSLMLACKRGNYQVVQILVALGAELYVKDFKDRTAKDIVRRKGNAALSRLLCPTLQVTYMKHQARRDVNFSMLKYRKLLQHERATVNLSNNTQESKPAPQILHSITNSLLEKSTLPPWRQALVKIMALPAPITAHIVTYMPNPDLWHMRLDMLAARCHLEADQATTSAFDLIDEVLIDAGFLTALSEAGIQAPLPFSSWTKWEEWGLKNDKTSESNQPSSFFDNSYHMFLSDDDSEAATSVDAVVAPPARINPLGHFSNDLDDAFYDFNIVIPHRRRRRPHIFFTPNEYPSLSNISSNNNSLDLRRKAMFLSLFNTTAPTSSFNPQNPFSPIISSNTNTTTQQQHRKLLSILTSPPYNMPLTLFEQLKQATEVEAFARRGSKFAHINSGKALKIVMLATELVDWYEQRRDKL